MSKIQDLKGTHNYIDNNGIPAGVVSDVKDTRFERNSQQYHLRPGSKKGCFWCQRYKIWKELTTLIITMQIYKLLFLMSKIQDLKGTHNLCFRFGWKRKVVSDVKDTRFERNSQPRNLQLDNMSRCFWCQRYKIWKELTTTKMAVKNRQLLFLMSKIQDLKGTHNEMAGDNAAMLVVSDVKDTRFERNSQLLFHCKWIPYCCFWCQRYKIWKELTTAFIEYDGQFGCFWCQRYKIWKELTTQVAEWSSASGLFLMSKIQDLKGTHNISPNTPFTNLVVSDVKDTRFERNSQLLLLINRG